MCDRNQSTGDAANEEAEGDGFDSNDEGGLRIDDDIYIPPLLSSITKLDTNGPRLVIGKIVNENFKSYAGTQVIGPFHKCFSAIVGPNGSGKSNAIDSMLFVFGYRASKIRSNKVSMLIHNSSEHTNVRSCTVSVHFNLVVDKSEANFDVVPNSEFVISRTAFKDNSSFYQLNGKKVFFKEVTKILRSHGVDLDHNRFLILQGEVEQIALMKPKGQSEDDTGMLEFLEDIIGTIRYKEPLQKLHEKVEVLTERRVEKMNRLRIIEKEKADLEKPMQAAVQYLKIENSIIELQHQLYHCKRFKMEEELVQQEAKKEELDKDFTDLVEQMEAVHAEIKEKSTEMKERCKESDELQQKKDTITEQYENIRKRDEALHAELVETNKRRKANTASMRSEKDKVEQLARVPEKNAKDIEECESLIEKSTASREREEATLTTLMSGLREKTEPLLKKRTQLETELISLSKDVDQAKATFEIAQSELNLYTSVEQKEKTKLAKLQESLKTTAETLKQRKQQLAAFEIKIPATQQSLEEARRELKDVNDRETEVGSRLRNMRIRVEEQRLAFQVNRSRNRMLDSLMQEKKEGRLAGIFGRLGDLGAIDAKYDVAISTACGPLDNVVVDTVTTAQECITFLRQNDIGRTTFIPLEKQQRFLSQCRQKIQTPENVPRLFDLIKVEDQRVLPAFYYGLQNTLVAEDLDQATRIAYGAQRYRVVTLKGELIEMSGTMSGGGRTVSKGRMGQSIIRSEPCAADVEQLQVNLDTVFEEHNLLKARQQVLENQIETLSVPLTDMLMDKEKYTVEILALGKQETLLRSQLEGQEKKVTESACDPKQVQKLTKAVEAARKKVDKAEICSKSVMDKVAGLNVEIEEVSGGQVKAQQQKITNLSKTIEKVKKEICRLQVAIKTAERDTKKMKQRIETFESDVHNCEQRIRDIQKEKTDLEAVARDVLKELNDVNEALVKRDEGAGTLKETLTALETRENKMKALKNDLNQKCKEMTKTLKELHQQITYCSEKIAALKLHIIPGESQAELKELTKSEIMALDKKSLTMHLESTKERLPEEIPNMQLIKDYQEKDMLYLRRVEDLEALTNERNNLRDTYDSVKRRRTQEFLIGFSLITTKLKETYQMITLGGDAELELVDSLDPFNEGIVFSVRPPKKSWKNISSLSGGEKTLSSLALVFALHHFKPTPLYFMDEIDAALDFKNVSIVGNYIKERTKNAQFIIISLRPNMFELADYLVGVYKTYNCTKCVPLDVGKFYKHNGPPPDRTESRQQGPLTQSLPVVRARENDRPHPEQAATCPDRIEETRTPEPTTSDNTFRLPELGLCPTPVRASNASERTTVEERDSEESVEKEPFRKKHKS